MWNSLEPHFNSVEVNHNKMSSIAQYRTNVASLVQYRDVFMTNVRNMSSLGKYIAFGTLSVSSFA